MPWRGKSEVQCNKCGKKAIVLNKTINLQVKRIGRYSHACLKCVAPRVHFSKREFIRLFNNNISQPKMAKKLGVSVASISRYAASLKLKRPLVKQNIAISNEQLIKLSTLSSTTIANMFGMSHQAILERFKRLNIKINQHDRLLAATEKYRKHHIDLSHFSPLGRVGCYYLGFIYADGCVSKKYANPNTLSIKLSTRDADWLIDFAADIGLGPEIIKTKSTKTSFKTAYLSRIVINNWKLLRILWQYGLDPRIDYKRHVPNVPYFDDFVRGFLDGDGSISRIHLKKTNKDHVVMRFAITHKSFGDELKQRIKEACGVDLNGPYKTKGIYVLTCSHKKACLLADWIWKSPQRCLIRKYKRYADYKIAGLI